MASTTGTSAVRVRVVRPQDAARLVPLFEAFYGTSFGEAVSADSVTRRIRQAEGYETVIVAEANGELAGFASLRVTPSLDSAPYAELTELFVEPTSRRLGVASKLVRYFEGLARERGAQTLVVLTGRTNTDAQTFYRSVGYDEHAVAMRKTLRTPDSP